MFEVVAAMQTFDRRNYNFFPVRKRNKIEGGKINMKGSVFFRVSEVSFDESLYSSHVSFIDDKNITTDELENSTLLFECINFRMLIV